MLVWWILSLIILIVCSIFAYRMIVSTYEFLPADKRYFLKFRKNTSPQNGQDVSKNSLKGLNKKVQPDEDNTTFYGIQFSKFQDRLKVLEELNTLKFSPEKILKTAQPGDDEDWKEMYYEENAIKEKLENELDNTRQMLEEAENSLKNSAGTDTSWVQLQSDYESRLHDLDSLQEQNAMLKRQLVASSERQNELEQLLLNEITVREKYTVLQHEYIQLQSESDDLKRNITDLIKKDADSQRRVAHLNELQSKLALCEEEKMRLKTNLQQLI